MNYPLFETCKELAKYLPMETKNHYRISDGKMVSGLTEYERKNLEIKDYYETHYYPAPTLEELLVNSPITISITGNGNSYMITTWYDEKRNSHSGYNLTEAVAQVMLQYYRGKE